MKEIITVSQLTSQIKKSLENEFSSLSIIGEISNFKAHISGHWYFNLKDSGAVVCCAMWRGMNNYVFFTPQDGMKVIINGRISVYPPKGQYQIDVRSMKPAGMGELQAAFEILKQKLAAEGLFDRKYKKTIPKYPSKIALVTAPDGAALKDLISVAKRRYPVVELITCPVKVQGPGAGEDIVKRIKQLNRIKDLDLIIIARGGGSIEDLWAFNEEILARNIFKSKVPVITGIGHEIDFTIADFVSDLRAPTPSVAMELATPDINDIFAFISDFSYNSKDKISELFSKARKRIIKSLDSYGFRMPLDLVRRKAQQMDNLIYRVNQLLNLIIMRKNNNLALITKSLEAHDVQKTLKKGFVLVKQDCKYITRGLYFNCNNEATLKFFDKEIKVNEKINDKSKY